VSAWRRLVPGRPWPGYHQADVFDNYFRGEFNISVLFGLFAGLSLLIALMGLFGLVSANLTRRVREIGIRRVMGARLGHVFGLVAHDLTWMMILAMVVAGPAALYLTRAMLDGVHTYHIPVTAVFPVATGLIILAAVAATLVSLVLRAARTDPAAVLRTE
jgi:putative ABC transport system permease protein